MMVEWIACADNPTRAMERMKSGEVVRCKDCGHYLPDAATGCWCMKLSRDVEPRGFCARLLRVGEGA